MDWPLSPLFFWYLWNFGSNFWIDFFLLLTELVSCAYWCGSFKLFMLLKGFMAFNYLPWLAWLVSTTPVLFLPLLNWLAKMFMGMGIRSSQSTELTSVMEGRTPIVPYSGCPKSFWLILLSFVCNLFSSFIICVWAYFNFIIFSSYFLIGDLLSS